MGIKILLSFIYSNSIIPLEKFNSIDISAEALHSAAFTFDGKVVMWECNDYGTLGRFASSTAANQILRKENYIIYEKNEPAYAESLDDVNIIKVVYGNNITFVISDQGHLYETEHLTTVDIVIGVNHALAGEQ
ncbi:regulator of chromosome condensation-like [Rhizophagus clarus]|uniref:Regulator of chromosome condensation-like n=1 Tax=Rhizophagus clarus TaxID=94130 RepID=A0A8H3KXV2_9GLOM|nr:regulator of chromosome condensation-like [Rhizophagus clarus]